MKIFLSGHFKDQLKKLMRKFPHVKEDLLDSKDLLVPLCMYAKSEQESITETELQYHFDRTIEEIVLQR